MKMDQVTIRTKYFEDEIRFYQETVGLTIQRRIEEGPLNIAFLADQKGDTCIEVIYDPEADSAGNPNLSIGFHTENAFGLQQDLTDKGYEVSRMENPAPVVMFFYVKDPAGVRVQFVEGGS